MKILLMKIFLFFRKKGPKPETPVFKATGMRTPLIIPKPPKGEEEFVKLMCKHAEEVMGFLPDPLLVMAMSPKILQEFAEFLSEYESHPRLNSNLLAVLRYLVAAKNDCRYCVTTSEAIMISQMNIELDDLRNAQEDPTTFPFPEKEKTLLLLVLKMVLEPDDVEKSDLEKAYKQGWTDTDIYEAANYAVRNLAVDLLLKAYKIDGQGAFA